MTDPLPISPDVVTVFGSRPQPQLEIPTASNIGGIRIDMTIEEFYEDSVEVTEHPVQSGAQITDHSFKRPMELVLVCGWSDSSISGLAGLGNKIAGSLGVGVFFSSDNPLAGTTGSFSGGAMVASDYVANIYSQLLQIQEARQPVAIVAGLRSYEKMLITSLRVQRDQKTKYALLVHAFFKQVILVDTQDSTVPPMANQAIPASTAATVFGGTVQLVEARLARGSFIP
jgi:hypothetical protein